MPVIEVRRYNRRETTKIHGYHSDISESLLAALARLGRIFAEWECDASLLMFSIRGMRHNVPTAQESLAAFSGGRAGQSHSITCYSGKPGGFFGGTCRSNVPPSHAIRESLTAFSGGRAGATSLHHMLFGKA